MIHGFMEALSNQDLALHVLVDIPETLEKAYQTTTELHSCNDLINPFATGDTYNRICVNFSTVYNDTLVAKGLMLANNTSLTSMFDKMND